jgi:hypothetical protein
LHPPKKFHNPLGSSPFIFNLCACITVLITLGNISDPIDPPEIETPVEAASNEGGGLVLEGVGIDDVDDRCGRHLPVLPDPLEQRFDPFDVCLNVGVEEDQDLAGGLSSPEDSSPEEKFEIFNFFRILLAFFGQI